MTRAAISIPSNIAEEAERRTRREFAQFLGIAKGSAAELRTQLYIASEAGFIAEDIRKKMTGESKELSRMMQGLIAAPLISSIYGVSPENSSFRAAFLVRISARAALVRASPDTSPDSGTKWHALSAKYDRLSHSWKIASSSPLEDSNTSYLHWSKWGMMHDGVCWALDTSTTPIKRDRLWILGRRNPVNGQGYVFWLPERPDRQYAIWREEKLSSLQSADRDRLLADGLLCRTPDGVANRMDRIESLGYGQVSDVAALAWEVLSGAFNL